MKPEFRHIRKPTPTPTRPGAARILSTETLCGAEPNPFDIRNEDAGRPGVAPVAIARGVDANPCRDCFEVARSLEVSK